MRGDKMLFVLSKGYRTCRKKMMCYLDVFYKPMSNAPSELSKCRKITLLLKKKLKTKNQESEKLDEGPDEKPGIFLCGL
jgi:hypothetical protein